MNWNKLNRRELNKLKKHPYVLVFHESTEYPYDIVQYGLLDGEEYWHSFLNTVHVVANKRLSSPTKYEYSNQELFDLFSYWMPITAPEGEVCGL